VILQTALFGRMGGSRGCLKYVVLEDNLLGNERGGLEWEFVVVVVSDFNKMLNTL